MAGTTYYSQWYFETLRICCCGTDVLEFVARCAIRDLCTSFVAHEQPSMLISPSIKPPFPIPILLQTLLPLLF